ncbi:dihydroxyacetone phosphate acyltransferase-like [Salvelinus alpinus]
MLKNIVYSDKLRYVINQVSQESGEAPDIIQEESCVILEEMAYRLQISTVHFFAFTLSKDFKTILQHLKQAIQEHPVVLLPSHCSYMDFLLMSYILYTYDLVLPVIIAAGSMGAEGATAPPEKSE